MRSKKNKIRQCTSDRVFTAVILFIVFIVLILTIYPVYYVLVASFAEPRVVNNGNILLYPVGFSLRGYQRVFSESRVFTGYMNTIFYTFCGVLFGLAMCLPAGYALSRKDVPLRGLIMGILVFTMYFGGGAIPFFILTRNLGLMNTRLVLIIYGGVSVYNIILIRTFFQNQIPGELLEAAFIDGCGNAQFFFKIALPLSKAIISVIGLYLAVGYWNNYYNAMMYVSDNRKWPLQLYLKELLASAESAALRQADDLEGDSNATAAYYAQTVKYGLIVVSTVPLFCLYPFIQKFFTKGVMIGSLKG